MKYLFIILLIILPLCCIGQQPGFRKLYNGETTGATFVDIVWDGEKLITTGQFLTDTASNNALNGLLNMELDTNGNVLFTDIYFHPNDAVTPQIQNSIYQSNNGLTYAMGQILDITSSYLSIYNDLGRISTVVIPVDGLQSWLYHCIDWNQNILLAGRRSNYQYDSEGMLIKSDPMGSEIWRKYYGVPNRRCGIEEPYIIDDNTIVLPGFKNYTPDNGPIINKWTRTWILTVDSLGNIKDEWESPKNVENGVATRMLKMPNGNWLYTTAEFIPMPGQIDDFGMRPKIVCRDSNFNLVWEQYFGNYPTSANQSIDLQSTSDGNYIVTGRSAFEASVGGCFIYKFAPNGEGIWRYLDNCEPIEDCEQYLGGITELPGGSTVAAGYVQNFAEGKVYGLLIKVDKNGCIDTLCSGTTGTYEVEAVSKIKVYPNPTSDILNISNPIGEKIEIFDISGKLVRTIPVQNETQSINIHDLPIGAYIVRMQEKALRVSYKIIKI
ncbi:MAG: hypothetical protein RIR11_1415 [Bacteroidota bacterium]